MTYELLLMLAALIAAMVSLGIATNLLVRSLQDPSKGTEQSEDSERTKHNKNELPRRWAYIAVLVFVFFGSTTLVLELLPVVSPMHARNGTSDIVSLSMGLIGLVITALTGMALSSAWRAKDQAEEAKTAASNALEQFSLREREFRTSSVLQLARIEALELKLKFAGGHKYRLQSSLANLLSTAFSAGSDKERMMILSRIATDDELRGAFSRYGLDGSGIYEYLTMLAADKTVSKHDKRNLFRLLK